MEEDEDENADTDADAIGISYICSCEGNSTNLQGCDGSCVVVVIPLLGR